ncbi:hypothetical protein ACOSQ2_020806 [Xanthoceras sorbifolium]
MAASIFYARSNSLPSSSHPFISEIDQHFYRLKVNSEATSSSICLKLHGLQDLHDCVDKLLLLPTFQEKNERSVNELLDGSLRILDLCSTAKDALVQIKEFTQELQSILRRRCGDNKKLAREVRKYLTSRKAVRKAIKKALANSKAKKLDSDHESLAMAGILKGVEAISLSVFESLLSFISGPKAQSKLSSWSLVSKLTHHKRVAFEELGEREANEFAKVYAALLSFIDFMMI